MEELEEVKNAVQVCLNFEKVHDIKLVNPKGRTAVSEMWKQYEKQNKMRNHIKDIVRDEMKPMQLILQMMAEKQGINIPKTVVDTKKAIEVETAIDNGKMKQVEEKPIIMEEVKKEKKKLTWTRKDTDEYENLTCSNGHILTIMKGEEQQQLYKIDDGTPNPYSNSQRPQLKAQIEAMEPVN